MYLSSVKYLVCVHTVPIINWCLGTHSILAGVTCSVQLARHTTVSGLHVAAGVAVRDVGHTEMVNFFLLLKFPFVI